MTQAFDTARISLVLADFANVDSSGKYNMLGAGLDIISIEPTTGATMPFTVVASADFSQELMGESPLIEVQLEEQSGQPFTIQQSNGESQAIRFGVRNLLGTNLPPGVVNYRPRPATRSFLNLANGLPLPAGRPYTWRVFIDGETKDEWTTQFYVINPAG